MSPSANSSATDSKAAITAPQAAELQALALSSLVAAPALQESPLALSIQSLGAKEYSEKSRVETALKADPIGALFVGISSLKQDERRSAKNELGKRAEAAPDEVLPHLVAGLSSRSGNVATCSMHIIGWLGAKGSPAVPALMEKLVTSTDEETQSVLAQMVNSCGEAGRHRLMSELFNPESSVRKFALSQLGGRASGINADRLIALLYDSDSVVKSFATMQIGLMASTSPDEAQKALPILKKLALEPLPRGTSVEADLESGSDFFQHSRVKNTALTALTRIDPLSGLEVLAASGKDGAHFADINKTMERVFNLVDLEKIPYSVKLNLLNELASGYDQRDYKLPGAPLEGEYFVRYIKPCSDSSMYKMLQASPSTKLAFDQEIDQHLANPLATIRQLALTSAGDQLKNTKYMHTLIDMMSDPVLEIERNASALLVNNFYKQNGMVQALLDSRAQQTDSLGTYIKRRIENLKAEK